MNNPSAEDDHRLSPEALRWVCSPGELEFATTANLPPGDPIVGQARAVHALEFSLTVDQAGYNERHLGNLYRTLGRNVPKAREMLRKLITEVRLTPVGSGQSSAHLEAEVLGNINGLLSLEPAYADTFGSGGPLLSTPVRRVLLT
jgi:hypothetical protein